MYRLAAILVGDCLNIWLLIRRLEEYPDEMVSCDSLDDRPHLTQSKVSVKASRSMGMSDIRNGFT